MDNKILVSVKFPLLEETYEIFIPVGKRIHTVIDLILKTINELSDENFPLNVNLNLYNLETGEMYAKTATIKESNITNGTEVVLI